MKAKHVMLIVIGFLVNVFCRLNGWFIPKLKFKFMHSPSCRSKPIIVHFQNTNENVFNQIRLISVVLLNSFQK